MNLDAIGFEKISRQVETGIFAEVENLPGLAPSYSAACLFSRC
jgi:hypothetical protein